MVWDTPAGYLRSALTTFPKCVYLATVLGDIAVAAQLGGRACSVLDSAIASYVTNSCVDSVKLQIRSRTHIWHSELENLNEYQKVRAL